MVKLLKKKRVLVPSIIILMLIVAYAKKIASDKEVITGHLGGPSMSETSGIAASGVYKDIYYIHNDSGDSARFFAITPAGKLVGTYSFKGEAGEPLGVRDCEDIAVGPGPVKDKSYIYLGDIGDNHASHPHITIYRFAEPRVDETKPDQQIDGNALYLKYPDGPKDAETLMLDPIERLLYIVSKRKNSVNVYTTPLDFKSNDTVTLQKRSTLHFRGLPPFKWITAGDISRDGTRILLKNYEHVYYWIRPKNEPVWQVMTAKPAKLYYKQEKQGEAIGFTPDGKGYYTASEGNGEPIYFYRTP